MKQGWQIKKLWEICDKGSSNISQNQLASNYGDYPIYGASGFIRNVDFYHNDKPYISIVKDGSGVGRVTKMEAFSSVIGTLQYLFPKSNITIDYLYYILSYIDFKKYHTGAAIPHIYFKDYKNESFSVPCDLEEQERIVRILDRAFAKIEALRANAEQNLQHAKDLFQTSIDKAYDIPTESKSIISVAKVINGYAFSSEDFKPTNLIKSIKITNVGVGEFIDESDNYLPSGYADKLQDVQVDSGDIVIALTRTIISAGLKVAVVPDSYDKALVNQRVAALVPLEGVMSRKYLYNSLLTTRIKNYVLAHVNTLMQPNLSITDLKNMDIPYLPYEEQNIVASNIDALSERCRAMEENYRQTIAHCNTLKQALLKKAFNGEL